MEETWVAQCKINTADVPGPCWTHSSQALDYGVRHLVSILLSRSYNTGRGHYPAKGTRMSKNRCSPKSTNRQVDTQDGGHPCSGVLISYKRERGSDTHYVEEPWKRDAQCKPQTHRATWYVQKGGSPRTLAWHPVPFKLGEEQVGGMEMGRRAESPRN